MERDLRKYHESIGKEFDAVKDRITSLIGNAHWPTHGSHLESVLRNVLRRHVPEDIAVGQGFVLLETRATHQCDVLLTRRSKPTLYKDGDLVVVTPDCVAAVIEVKASTAASHLGAALTKLAGDVEQIRQQGNADCRAGLFVYHEPESLQPETVMKHLCTAANGRETAAINWLSLGRDSFIRFWSQGDVVRSVAPGAVWHSYHLPGLAQAYFVSNVVLDDGSNAAWRTAQAWYPVEGTKETRREWYCALDSGVPQQFASGTIEHQGERNP